MPDYTPRAEQTPTPSVETTFRSEFTEGAPMAPLSESANDSDTNEASKAELFAVEDAARAQHQAEQDQLGQLEDMVGRLEQATSIQLGEAISLFEEQLVNERQLREAAEAENVQVVERLQRMETDLLQATEALEAETSQRETQDEMRDQLACLENALHEERQRRRAAEGDADVAEERVASLTRRMEESRGELSRLRQDFNVRATAPTDSELEERFQQQRERFQRQITVLEDSERAAQGFASRIEEKFKHFTAQRRAERKQLDNRIQNLEDGLDHTFSSLRMWRAGACIVGGVAAFELGALLLAFL